MNFFKGYRTIVVNTATALVGLALTFDWVTLGLSPQRAGLVMAGLGVANIMLRLLTSTPAGKGE